MVEIDVFHDHERLGAATESRRNVAEGVDQRPSIVNAESEVVQSDVTISKELEM